MSGTRQASACRARAVSAASPVLIGAIGTAFGVTPVLLAAGAGLVVASHLARRDGRSWRCCKVAAWATLPWW